ncbi:MAG: hypothetical protein ABSC06_32475 [Rhodopila sp.]|jgi:hypothetical protein
MRPESIAAFEATFFGSLALGVLQSALQWQHLAAVASMQFVVAIQCTVFAVLIFILGVSRGRSTWAKRFLMLSFALGIPATYHLLMQNGIAIPTILALMQTSIQAIGLGMLFTPSATAWLGGSRR